MSQIRVRSSNVNSEQAALSGMCARWAAPAARLIAGLLLLGAAALKAYQAIWLDPSPSPWLDLIAVAVEVPLGLWLLSSLARRLSHLTALACFVLFAIINFGMGQSGATSCGCYGPVEVNPWVSLLINLGAILALGLTFPRSGPWLKPGGARAMAAVAGLALVLLVPALVLMTQDRREAYDPEAAGQRTVYVEPDRWLGQSLPILAAIDDGERLRHGRWEVFFYKHDCPACRSQLQQKLTGEDPAPRHTRRMMVEIPPYESISRAAQVRRAGWRYARLNDERTWFFPTPTLVHLEEGRVVQVNDNALTSGASQDTSSTPGVTEAEPSSFEPPPPHDLGYVPAAGVREFVMQVTNPLDRDLTIRRVEVECICTELLQRPETIPAGQTIDLPMRFEALEEPQLYAKQIALYTTDSALPVIRLTVQASIGIPLTVEPQVVDAAVLADEGEVELTIRNHSEHSLRLLYSSASLRDTAVGGGSVFAAVPRQAIPAGHAVSVVVRRTGDAVEPADLQGYLQIHTDSSEQPTLSVPIR